MKHYLSDWLVKFIYESVLAFLHSYTQSRDLFIVFSNLFQCSFEDSCGQTLHVGYNIPFLGDIDVSVLVVRSLPRISLVPLLHSVCPFRHPSIRLWMDALSNFERLWISVVCYAYFYESGCYFENWKLLFSSTIITIRLTLVVQNISFFVHIGNAAHMSNDQ